MYKVYDNDDVIPWSDFRTLVIQSCMGFWWENLRERDHWGDPGLGGRIILRRIFRKWDVGYGLDRAGSG
jgi:hypothetical protein